MQKEMRRGVLTPEGYPRCHTILTSCFRSISNASRLAVHGQTNRPRMQARWYYDVESRSAGRCPLVKLKKLNSMSIPPALPKPQLMTRDASEDAEPPTHAAPKSPKTTQRTSFHLQILYTVCASLLFFLVFGEDEANRRNRLVIRNGISGAAIALNRPLPWDVPSYNLKQPTGDQVLKPLKLRPLVQARALQRQRKEGAAFSLNRPVPWKSWETSTPNSEFKTTLNSNATTPSNSSNHE